MTAYSLRADSWERLNALAAEKDAGDPGDPRHQNWSVDRNLLGLVGEALVAYLSGWLLSAEVVRRDGGTDFPGLDVKASPHWDDPLLKVSAGPLTAALYFLAAVDLRARRARPVGFATRAMLEQAPLRDFGYGPCRVLSAGELLSAFEVVPRLGGGQPPAEGWRPMFDEARDPGWSSAQRDASWLCAACRERGLRPIHVAVRDGLCGWCWLTEYMSA